MKYRQMGSLPWKVSALGFGCMRLPTMRFLPRINEKKAVEIIRFGIDQGINYLDTAWLYNMGQSETVLGKALKNGYREKVRVATKLPMILVKKEADFDKFLDQQLERLDIGAIDMYLFHMLNDASFERVKRLHLLDKMERARADGKIKHIGFSFHDTLPVFRKIIDHYPWDMTLIQYNYMDTSIQATTEGLQYAHARGMAVVIMEPLKGGQLATPTAEVRAVMNATPVRRTPVDWALQFLWNRPEISCVLSGMNSRTMVEENCASADSSGVGALSPDENGTIGKIAQLYRKKIIVPCTACGYCMPCPSGVDIPQNFALLNNKSFGLSGKFPGSVMQFFTIGSYRRLASSKKGSALKKDHGRASMCIHCNGCIKKCPQGINIPQELEKVVAVFEKGKSVTSLQGL